MHCSPLALGAHALAGSRDHGALATPRKPHCDLLSRYFLHDSVHV
jgi:hypothetical protein